MTPIKYERMGVSTFIFHKSSRRKKSQEQSILYPLYVQGESPVRCAGKVGKSNNLFVNSELNRWQHVQAKAKSLEFRFLTNTYNLILLIDCQRSLLTAMNSLYDLVSSRFIIIQGTWPSCV